MIVKRVVQRVQRTLQVAQPDAHDRIKPIGNVRVLLCELPQCVLCFASAARAAERIDKGGLSERITGTYACGRAQRGDRFLVPLLLHQRLSETEVKLVPSRLELHGFLELVDRLVEASAVI